MKPRAVLQSLGISMLTVMTFTLLIACASLEKPQGLNDTIGYSEAGAQATQKTLDGLTCYKYLQTGTCAEAGKPVHPAQAKEYLDMIQQARAAGRAAATMPTAGGACLGQPSTPTACLALASSMLGVVQGILTSIQKK